MKNHGIHGNLLEITDTEWISRQDPYVCVEYGSNRNRTRVCTGKNPTFQEKFVFSMIEGLRELNFIVWNSNTVSHDDFIGSGKHAAEKPTNSYAPSAAPYGTSSAPQVRMYFAPPLVSSVPYQLPASLPPYPSAGAYPAPSPYSSHPPNSGAYLPPSYPPQAAPYPPQPYPPSSAYPPQPYGSHYSNGSSCPGGYPPPY